MVDGNKAGNAVRNDANVRRNFALSNDNVVCNPGFIYSHANALAPNIAASDSLRWLTKIFTLF